MKKTRQQRILEIISENEVDTQEELASILVSQGFSVTQATVSRDIKELALIKVKGNIKKSKYAIDKISAESNAVFSDRYAGVLKSGIVSVLQADNLVVIKTVSGMAMAVAAAVDELGIEEIVGSIAGDDTIMCAVKTASLVPAVIEKIKNSTQEN